jgi:hypothetical protein
MSKWIRQFHRWTSIVFTLAVIANFVAMGVQGADRAPDAITYSPLPPLLLLLLTGLYMFFLPYVGRREVS